MSPAGYLASPPRFGVALAGSGGWILRPGAVKYIVPSADLSVSRPLVWIECTFDSSKQRSKIPRPTNSSGAMRNLLLVIGPAGCGKSTLVGALSRWLLRKQLIPSGIVNLDPGAEVTPYEAHVNVRKYVRSEEVMLREGLGPNGALIRSIELLMNYEDELMEELERLTKPYILVDTPGQMELFLFREFGLSFTEKLKKLGAVVAVLVIDPTLGRRPQDIVVLKLLSLVVQLRFGIDVVPVINKADLLENKLEGVDIFLDSDTLRNRLHQVPGVMGDLSEQILDVLENFKLAMRIPTVSALREEGLEQLYDILHEIFCACGDLT
ncbi:MAG: ATP/GTP-binding protein [Thermofilum sp.]